MKKIMSALFLSCLIFSTYCKADAKDDSFHKFAKNFEGNVLSLKDFVDSRDELSRQTYFIGIVNGIKKLSAELTLQGAKNEKSICFKFSSDKSFSEVPPYPNQVFDEVMQFWKLIHAQKKDLGAETFQTLENMALEHAITDRMRQMYPCKK